MTGRIENDPGHDKQVFSVRNLQSDGPEIKPVKMEVLEKGQRKSEHLGFTDVAFRGSLDNSNSPGLPPQRAEHYNYSVKITH